MSQRDPVTMKIVEFLDCYSNFTAARQRECKPDLPLSLVSRETQFTKDAQVARLELLLEEVVTTFSVLDGP